MRVLKTSPLIENVIINIFLFLSLSLTAVTANRTLESPKITNWGVWGEFEVCPEGKYVKGMQLKTEQWFIPPFDNTCLNGIRFFCGDPLGDNTVALTSSVGSWGKWGNLYTCGEQHVIGFQLKVQAPSFLPVDETATNNVRVFCSNTSNEHFIEGDGERWGSWSQSQICGRNEAFCGLKTQVQPDQGLFRDDTALNNIAVLCCNMMKMQEV